MTGGMISGIGQALLERSETDGRAGRFVSKNLAGYLVPIRPEALASGRPIKAAALP
jgi:xanthine dehydrogenase YagR molybdenum-binding subunit